MEEPQKRARRPSLTPQGSYSPRLTPLHEHPPVNPPNFLNVSSRPESVSGTANLPMQRTRSSQRLQEMSVAAENSRGAASDEGEKAKSPGKAAASAPIAIDSASTAARISEEQMEKHIRSQLAASEEEMYWRLSSRGIAVEPPDLNHDERRRKNKESPDPQRVVIHTRMGSRKRSSQEMLFAMDGLEL
mmetsp:Transcript_59201/g.118809  ORF Transcript_59201/g.118809 Transcript_59201/m.118809 type:complete len:188 (-) Transcript_59201:461-1024(-)